MRALPVAAAVVTGVAVVSSGLGGPAAAAPRAQDAVLSVPPAGGTASDTFRSGVWPASRDNPPAPAGCGLNLALLFDLSGSVAPNIGLYKAAGQDFVRALQDTPSAVGLYTFSSNAPANTTNNANVPLTPVGTAAQAAPLIAHINGFTATGGTNRDRGIWQIAASAQRYDIAVVLTGGNPTYFGTGRSGPGNRARLAEAENGIFAANALKHRGTRIIAVGIGPAERLPGSISNLRAIAGAAAGSDYINTSFADLAPVLRRLALTNCAGIDIKKSAAPVSYHRPGQQIHYTYTVTNTGSFFPLHDVTVTGARITGPVHCQATVLAPGAKTTCTAAYTTSHLDVDAGHVTIAAVATGTTPNGDVLPSDPVHATVHARQRPAITIVQTASVHSFDAAGLPITYFYRVTNTGNVTLIPSASGNRSTGVVCPHLLLAPGASMTCRSYHVTTEADVAAGHVANTGFSNGTTVGGTEVHADAPLDIPQVHAAEISILKLASVDSFAVAGTPVTYYYWVANTGNATLNPVTVTDSRGLPVSCPHPSLAPGELMICTAHYVTTQADVDRGTIANTGTVAGRTPGGAEVTDHSSLDIPAVQAPAISVAKTASTNEFTAAGQQITYSYLVTNNGNVALDQVTVADIRGLLQSGPPPTGSPSPGLPPTGLPLSCPRTSLAAGQAMTCTAVYRTTQADVSAGVVINIALALGSTPSGDPVFGAGLAFVLFTGFFPVTG